MKIKLFNLVTSIILFSFASVQLFAQAARPTQVLINKVTQPAYQADYKQSKKLLQLTIDDKFKKLGFSKSKSFKGYRKLEGVIFNEISANKLDIYYKLSGKRSTSTMVMLISSGYDNFIDMAKDELTASNTILFLNNLDNDARDMQAALDLALQQKALKKAEEKLKKEAAKKAKLDSQLAKSTKEKADAAKKVEEERMRLENLKGKNEAIER